MAILNKIVIYAFLGVLVLGWTLFGMEKCSHNKDVTKLTAELNNCLNAPVKRDTVFIHDTVTLNRVIRPKPINTVITVKDTSDCIEIKKAYFDTNYYAETLKTADFDLNWGASVTQNQLAQIKFVNYNLHTREIHVTKTVDTCFNKPPEYKPKNHFGFEVAVSGNNLNQFPNVSAGLFFTFKDKFGISLGTYHNTYNKETYLESGIKLFVR